LRKPGSTRRGGKCPGLRSISRRFSCHYRGTIICEAAQRQKPADTKGVVKFKVEDVVLVSTQNLSLKRVAARKLLPRFMGPFP
jgi:hypothetical protein